MRNRTILAGTVLLALSGGASAHAATVSVADQTLRFTAQSGESNVVTIGRDFSPVITVIDKGAPLAAGNACATVDAHTVTCEAGAATATAVDLGDGDDQLLALITGGDATVSAGLGNDSVAGVAALYFGGKATLHGDDGNDRIRGATSMDNQVYGDGGADQLSHWGRSGGLLDGGAGDDHLRHNSLAIGTLRGGSGRDVLEHSDAVADMPAMDGGADDDELRLALQGGVVAHAPSVHGGSGTDRVVLSGVGSSVALSDRPVPDFDLTIHQDVERLHGTPGADRLRSNGAAHVIFGGEGDDWIDGGAGNDQLFGEAGDDQLLGGSGRDALDGGAGRDVLDARDGERDASLICGDGADSALTDAADRFARISGCETVSRSARR